MDIVVRGKCVNGTGKVHQAVSIAMQTNHIELNMYDIKVVDEEVESSEPGRKNVAIVTLPKAFDGKTRFQSQLRYALTRTKLTGFNDAIIIVSDEY